MRLDTSLDISVHPEVYDPSDDSYLLLKVADVEPGEKLLDMGSGTGLIAIHAAKCGASVLAADLNPFAVECTRRNAARNGVRIQVVSSDLFEKITGNFDVITFNPPYLPGKESSTSWIERSWAGGSEGSEITVRFLKDAWMHLTPGGRAYVILSSTGGFATVLKAAKERYDMDLLAEQHMFFESIFAYRFKLRSSQSTK